MNIRRRQSRRKDSRFRKISRVFPLLGVEDCVQVSYVSFYTFRYPVPLYGCAAIMPLLSASFVQSFSPLTSFDTGPEKLFSERHTKCQQGQSEQGDIDHEHIIIHQTFACIRSSLEEDPVTILKSHWGTIVDIQARKKPWLLIIKTEARRSKGGRQRQLPTKRSWSWDGEKRRSPPCAGRISERAAGQLYI